MNRPRRHRAGDSPQVAASDPAASVFVAANAGSGKTKTLVDRVARLLLTGVAARGDPLRHLHQGGGRRDAAAAVQGARRLGGDGRRARCARRCGGSTSRPATCARARALFARALETPGGIKITTIHAFCEKLLKRFPLEAGVSPGFTVLDDVGRAPGLGPGARGPGARRARASGRPDRPRLQLLLGRARLPAASTRCSRPSRPSAAPSAPTSRHCAGRAASAPTSGAAAASTAETPADEIEAEAVGDGSAGASGGAPPMRCWPGPRPPTSGAARRCCAIDESSPFAEVWAIFANKDGDARRPRGDQVGRPVGRAVAGRRAAAARRGGGAGEGGPHRRGQRPRGQPGARLRPALRRRQGCAPGARLRRPDRAHPRAADGARRRRLGALQARRRHRPRAARRGAGHRARAVGHPAAPSPPSSSSARAPASAIAPCSRWATRSSRSSRSRARRPERLAAETQSFGALVGGSGRRFLQVPLLESWRSTPEVLSFVDAVFDAAGDRRGGPEAGRQRRASRCSTCRRAAPAARWSSGRWRRPTRPRRPIPGRRSTPSRRRAPTRSSPAASPAR